MLFFLKNVPKLHKIEQSSDTYLLANVQEIRVPSSGFSFLPVYTLSLFPRCLELHIAILCRHDKTLRCLLVGQKFHDWICHKHPL